MPKYLIEATYSHDGLKGLTRDKASGRSAAVKKTAESIGGKVDAIYYTFGDSDVIVIADFPDNITATALSLAVSSSGLVRTKTTPLLTVEEVDRAIGKTVQYQPPGR